MLQRLEVYRADPTLKNAGAIRAHARKHPFSLCLLNKADNDLMLDAIHRINMSEA